MNWSFLISGITVFVAVAFLIINTQDTVIVYGCVKSSSTNQTNSSGANGTSGNLTKTLSSSSHGSLVDVAAKLLNVCCPCGPPS